MRYHYRIISSFDLTDIPVDSGNFCGEENHGTDEFQGFRTEDMANTVGESELKQYNTDQYYVQVYPVAENVTEQDIMDGMVYPEDPYDEDNGPLPLPEGWKYPIDADRREELRQESLARFSEGIGYEPDTE